jgi:hypothetical protein
MSFVPRSSNSELWSLLGLLAAAIVGLEWWSRRERARADAAAEPPNQACVPGDESAPADHGWSH